MTRRVIFSSGGPGSWGLQFVVEGVAGAVDLDVNLQLGDDGYAKLRADHIGIHGFRPTNECAARRDDCNILPDGFCWFDASCSSARDVLERLRVGGEHALWSELEEWYRAHLTDEAQEAKAA